MLFPFELGTIHKKSLDSKKHMLADTVTSEAFFLSSILTGFKRMKGISWILSGQFPQRFLPPLLSTRIKAT